MRAQEVGLDGGRTQWGEKKEEYEKRGRERGGGRKGEERETWRERDRQSE